jgi:hypothetical protein
MSYEPPLMITIPVPMTLPTSRGANATGKRGGNLRIRCTNKEYDFIQEEASKLGITLAMFCRWCATRVATELEQHRLKEETNSYAGEDHE